jgi:hypothetical protein
MQFVQYCYLSDMQENVMSRALCWVGKRGMLAELWQGNTLQDDRQENREYVGKQILEVGGECNRPRFVSGISNVEPLGHVTSNITRRLSIKKFHVLCA